MAGENPKLVVRVGANVEELKRALAEGRVLIDNTASSLGRMTASLRGDKLLQEAQKLVQGVEAAGGALTLTSKQQTRVNAQLQEAIEKYALLGPAAQKASGIAIAEMRQLEAETRKVETRTGALSGLWSKFGPMLATSFSVGAVTAGVRSLVRWADDLDEVAQGIGMNVERLQQLQQVWATTGSSIEAGTKAIQTMQERLGSENAGTIGALEKLNLNWKTVKQMAPELQYDLITQKLREVTDQTEFATTGAAVFGKTWKSVGLSVKNSTQESIDAVRTLTEEQITSIAILQGKLEALQLRARIIGGNLIAPTQSPYLRRSVIGMGTELSLANESVLRMMGGLPGMSGGKSLEEQQAMTDWWMAAQRGWTARKPIGKTYGTKSAQELQAELLASVAVSELEIKWFEHDVDAAMKAKKAVDLLKVSRNFLREEMTWGADAMGKDTGQLEFYRSGLLAAYDITEASIDILPEYAGSIDQAAKFTEDAAKATKGWRSELSGLAGSFRLLQQSAGEGGLAGVAQAAASVTGSMEIGAKGSLTFAENLYGVGDAATTTSGRMTAMASGALQMAAAMEQATQSTSHWQNAISGAATGAAMGATFGPYGAAAGAGIGAIYGYYKGTSGDDVTEAQRRQWVDSLGGYAEFYRLVQRHTITVDQYNAILTAGKDGLEAFKETADAIGLSVKDYRAQLNSLTVAAQGTKTIAEAMGVQTTQAQFDRLGTYTSAIFGKMLRETGSLTDALAAVGDTLDAMIASGRNLGLTISGPLGELLNFRGILTNNPDLSARITGLGQIGGLGNLLGPMNLQATFGADLADTFKELLARGGVSENQALMLMQGPLQSLWESTRSQQEQQMLSTDTMALLDLALGRGFVGENMMSIQSRQLEVLTQIRDLMAGGTSPARIPDWLPPPDLSPNPQYWPVESFSGGSGGYRNFGAGTPAMLHGWEAVVPLSTTHAGAVAGEQTITIPVYLDGRQIALSQVKHLPWAVRRYTRVGA